MEQKLPRIAWALGLSGLIPQILAVAITLHPPHIAFGQFAAFLYAALILSFLGGLWWGVAAVHQSAPRWLYVAGVAPSLVAFAAGLLWIMRSGSPDQALTIVGGGLLLAPIVDLELNRRKLMPRGWFAMRTILSVGLGVLTLLAAR